MVNLFSFGCHAIGRDWLSTDCKGRVGETVRRVLASPHFVCWTFTKWSIDSCQNRIATDQYPMTISRAHVSTYWGDVIYSEAVRWTVIILLDRDQFSVSYFLPSLGSEHRKTDTRQCFVNVVIHWQLTRYPLTSITWLYRGLRCRPIEVFFWSYPLTRYWFLNDRRLKFNFFKNSYEICCVYVPHN